MDVNVLPSINKGSFPFLSFRNAHEHSNILGGHTVGSSTHEQIIICRQLFPGHVKGAQTVERKKFEFNDNY